jgi:hypothetical protein
VKDDELLRQWILQRAPDLNIAADKRAEAYVVLASKDWECSFRISELPANKTVSESEVGSQKIRWSKPEDVAQFEKARRCAADGLAMTEAAIALVPDSGDAWTFKSNLLIEMTKLAEMDGNDQLKTEYERQQKAARLKSQELEAEDNGRPRKP